MMENFIERLESALDDSECYMLDLDELYLVLGLANEVERLSVRCRFLKNSLMSLQHLVGDDDDV